MKIDDNLAPKRHFRGFRKNIPLAKDFRRKHTFGWGIVAEFLF